MNAKRLCSDCENTIEVDRRRFLKSGSVAVAAAALLGPRAFAAPSENETTADTLAQTLFEKLSPDQRAKMCFDWDYEHPEMGLLRTRVANNWQITPFELDSDFYTDEQRDLVKQIFEGVIHPDWHSRFYQQLEDDAGGFGLHQSIAMFGKPGDKFEFVLTGRHMTLRCDGNTTEHVAFGGPLFYGHAASGFNEAPDHPGNVFWSQAKEANLVFDMLDGKQREIALVKELPREQAVAFRETGFPGIPVKELSADQKGQVQKTLGKLVEMYRQVDRDEIVECVEKQGGLDACSLAFYSDGDVGADKVWDCWRLEGPSIVWYFRGDPHVHAWINVADSPEVKTNA